MAMGLLRSLASTSGKPKQRPRAGMRMRYPAAAGARPPADGGEDSATDDASASDVDGSSASSGGVEGGDIEEEGAPVPPHPLPHPPEDDAHRRERHGVPWGRFSYARVNSWESGSKVHIGWGVCCGQHADPTYPNRVCKLQRQGTDDETRRRMLHWLVVGHASNDRGDGARAHHMSIEPRRLGPPPSDDELVDMRIALYGS